MEDIKSNGLMEPLDIPEEEIPWYRMRWFFIVTFILFYPAMLIIGLTGNVYGKQKGVAFKLSNKIKYMLMLTGFILILVNILRNF